MRVDEVALRLNDEVNSRRAQLILFLLGIKGLLLQFARLAGGIDLGAVLRQGNVGVADVEQRSVFHLLQLRFEPTLRQDSALIVRLRRAVADGDLHVQRYLVVREVVVKGRAQGVAETGLRDAVWRESRRRKKVAGHGIAVCVQHEIDHLSGKIFVEYLSPLKRARLAAKLRKKQKLAG